MPTVTAAPAGPARTPGAPAVPEAEPPSPRGEPARALLLNASLEPLCVVSVHRAVALVMAGKATVVESLGVLRSERFAMPAPVVACLTRYVHVPLHRPVPPTPRTVLARDAHRCAYCGGCADTVDHVLPRSRGGRHEWTNVVAACVRCNHRKADRLLHEIGWQLGFAPRAPRWSVAFGVQAARAEPAWVRYLVA